MKNKHNEVIKFMIKRSYIQMIVDSLIGIIILTYLIVLYFKGEIRNSTDLKLITYIYGPILLMLFYIAMSYKLI